MEYFFVEILATWVWDLLFTYFAFFVEADFPYLFFPWKLDSSFLGLNIVFNKLDPS